MATPSRIVGAQVFADAVTFLGPVTLPDDTVGDDQIPDGAAIDPLKLGHIHARTYAQPNTTATTETRVIHVVAGATGEVLDIAAGLIAACTGGATVTFDLKKSTGGGAFATMLSAPISLGNADAAIVPKSGVLVGTPTVVADDVLEVVITATAGGGAIGTGAFCHVRIKEAAQ